MMLPQNPRQSHRLRASKIEPVPGALPVDKPPRSDSRAGQHAKRLAVLLPLDRIKWIVVHRGARRRLGRIAGKSGAWPIGAGQAAKKGGKPLHDSPLVVTVLVEF